MSQSTLDQVRAQILALVGGTPAKECLDQLVGRELAIRRLGDDIDFKEIVQKSNHIVDCEHLLKGFLAKAKELDYTDNRLCQNANAYFFEAAMQHCRMRFKEKITECSHEVEATYNWQDGDLEHNLIDQINAVVRYEVFTKSLKLLQESDNDVAALVKSARGYIIEYEDLLSNVTSIKDSSDPPALTLYNACLWTAYESAWNWVFEEMMKIRTKVSLWTGV